MLMQSPPRRTGSNNNSTNSMTTTVMTMMMPTSSKDSYSPMKVDDGGRGASSWKQQYSSHTMDTEATEDSNSSLGGGEVLVGDLSEHCYQLEQPEDHEEEEATPATTPVTSASGRKPARRQVSSTSTHSVPFDVKNNKSSSSATGGDWHDSFALDDDIDISSSTNPLIALKGSISDLLKSVTTIRKNGSDEEDADNDDDEDVPEWEKPYDPTEELEELQFTKADIKSVVMDPEAFRTLQRSLRQRQCCTNLYLSQTMHCYVKHVKEVRQRNEAKLSRSASMPAFKR